MGLGRRVLILINSHMERRNGVHRRGREENLRLQTGFTLEVKEKESPETDVCEKRIYGKEGDDLDGKSRRKRRVATEALCRTARSS